MAWGTCDEDGVLFYRHYAHTLPSNSHDKGSNLLCAVLLRLSLSPNWFAAFDFELFETNYLFLSGRRSSNEHAFLAWIDAGQILRFLQVDDTEIYIKIPKVGGRKEKNGSHEYTKDSVAR